MTRKVACATWPGATLGVTPHDSCVTVHPVGAERLKLTGPVASAPLLVKVSVAVAAWPAVSLVIPSEV